MNQFWPQLWLVKYSEDKYGASDSYSLYVLRRVLAFKRRSGKQTNRIGQDDC